MKIYHAISAAGLVATLIMPSMAFSAESTLGREFKIGKSGQPVCSEPAQLKEFLMAAVSGDKQWLSQVTGCGMLKSGTKVIVIEDDPESGSELGRVIRIRAFAKGGSAVAYTLTIGLE